MNNKRFLAVFGALLVLALLLGSMLAPLPSAIGAPAAAVTPVSFSGQAGNNEKVTFFEGRITADTRTCFDLSNYNKIDLQWVIDQGTVNTTTLKLQWSNDASPTVNPAGNFEDTVTFVSANTSDTHSGQQYILAGQFTCVFADVANSNSLGLKIKGVGK